MSEDKELKQWKEKLFYQPKNGYDRIDAEQAGEIFAYAEGYKQFLDAARTEREAVKEAIRMAEAEGFVPYTFGMELQPGSKVYVNNRGKALMLAVLGQQPLDHGCVIAGAHIDSPRLDLKQTPMYEDSELAYFKTHYYGGIKKYQWVTLPLAIHGVFVRKDGTVVKVAIGEKPEDPVFFVSDLLIHLAQEQMTKSAATVVEGEALDVIVGNIPLHYGKAAKDGKEGKDGKDSAGKDAVKKGVLRLLKEQYGVEEEDFLSAELEVVPAGRAREAGFDRSMILSYGQDDRVCAYGSLEAMLAVREVQRTACCILVDKEEIGSVGATGMQSRFFENTVAELLALAGKPGDLALRRTLAHSTMLSSDVSSAFDPLYASAFDKKNVACLGGGMVLNKFTGARGKSGSNDANAEYLSHIRSIYEAEKVNFQMAELGKVDLGGGGTIAYIMALYGMNVIDSGVAVLSMHSPWEATSKADVYETMRGYQAFLKRAQRV